MTSVLSFSSLVKCQILKVCPFPRDPTHEITVAADQKMPKAANGKQPIAILLPSRGNRCLVYLLLVDSDVLQLIKMKPPFGSIAL